MRTNMLLIVVLIVGLIATAQGEPLQQAGSSPQANASRVHVKRITPHAQTDTILEEAWIIRDSTGRRRVSVRGPYDIGKLTRLKLIVDSRTDTYRVVKMTGNDQADAARLQKVYREYAFETNVGDLASRLKEQRLQAEERSREERGRSMKRQIGQLGAADCLPSSSGDMPQHGPLAVDELEANSALEQNWSYVCAGQAWSMIKTEDPPMYLFPFTELNRTNISAAWSHKSYPGGYANYVQVIHGGDCWANPTSFLGTVWIKEWCYPNGGHTWDNAWDRYVVGHYRNDDFFAIRTLWCCGTLPIWVTATVSVEGRYGVPIWGADYTENVTSSLAQFIDPWLLHADITGEAWQDPICSYQCDPQVQALADCEAQGDPFHWDWEVCDCVSTASPVLIDLDNDGLALTSSQSGVRFDILANGNPVRVAWTSGGSRDAFLALDRNQNDVIDSGAELFGNVTEQPSTASRSPRKREPNGFLALSVFDEADHGGNSDGQITEADSVYNALRLWIDVNHNGESESAELFSLASEGIRAVSLHFTVGKKVDEFGNIYRYRSHVSMDRDAFDSGPNNRKATDIFLVYRRD